MFDVLPEDEKNGSDSSSRSQSRIPSNARGGNVVKIEWKLPARLRKPIRQQLRRQRTRKQRARHVAGFSRITPPSGLGGRRRAPVQDRSRRGMRRGSALDYQGKIRLTPPPYRGAHMQRATRVPRIERAPRPKPSPRPRVSARPIHSKRLVESQKKHTQEDAPELKQSVVRRAPSRTARIFHDIRPTDPVVVQRDIEQRDVTDDDSVQASQAKSMHAYEDEKSTASASEPVYTSEDEDEKSTVSASEPVYMSEGEENSVPNMGVEQSFPVFAERDIPFSWDGLVDEEGGGDVEGVNDETKESQRVEEKEYITFDEVVEEESEEVFAQVRPSVEQPRRAFFSPLQVRILPSVSSMRKTFAPKESKSTRWYMSNLSILLVGCIIASFVFWNLQGAGRGFAVLSSIQDRSASALQELANAQVALADTDFDTSGQLFEEANVLLSDARHELHEALSTSQYILRVVDVTGTLSSGQRLLSAGESLTRAGQHMSFVMTQMTQSSFGLEEGEDSTYTLVDAIDASRPKIEETIAELREAQKALDGVSSPFFPEEVSEYIESLQISIPHIITLLEKAHEESGTLLYVLGADRHRTYLILFVNNHEIRPVGGFIGTVGLVHMDRGKVESIDISSVYDPDGQLREYIAPPAPLLPIVDRWYMRDANWFVDYSVSAQKIANFFEKQGGPTVDGVMLMTPQVIERLLDITGPIQVPGYDVSVSSDTFVEVTQDQVTYSYDREVNRPKQFLADFAPVLLNRVFSDEGEGMNKLEVVTSLLVSLEYKDLLLYFRDDDIQQDIVRHRWGGTYPQDRQGFLSVNNANIGGHKSDKFIDQEIDARYEIKQSGDVEVVLTIRRTHNGSPESIPGIPDYNNPAMQDNIIYQRVLVPKNTRLIEAKGFARDTDVPSFIIPPSDVPLRADPDIVEWTRGQVEHESGTQVGTEAGYTFFGNWVITAPGQTSVALYRYVIPEDAVLPSVVSVARSYSAYIAKQPGDTNSNVRVSLSFPSGHAIAHTVPSSGITREGDRSIVYRGDVAKDKIVGAVFERAKKEK